MCCKSIGLRVGLQLFLFCKVLAFCLVVFVVELCFGVAPNGSADLRSPEKEVCFRSWDLANSQMCEVRVATSNICGCNPPNRCGKRSGADFATSEKVLAKCGNSKNQKFKNSETKQMLFQIV